ncbi:glutamate-1-semialdehyde 2,1-aminomutase [Desulfitibacter alkalitolerans]|uniref:glutamate-1-semialdehyde 2,1-aminomutase n=1 Tax=Desulfitibacter alkalitolerans TaxID=264641 RepID=UPI0004854D25|nr:glutamate-1-semialdehyde 2,1-aminomutase [Desulfitibacter alkalitolerans]
MLNMSRSKEMFIEAQKYIPGGVNSPVRAFKSVKMDPPFIASGKGVYIFDEDGNRYIDYVASWGPLILGHCHTEVVNALHYCLEIGTSFGAPTELETKMAKLVIDCVPSIEMVRMVNSGTEATMSALRLARGYTGRDKIVKFEGCYHGHADFLLIKAGSGALTHGVPTSPGVPNNTAQNTITAPFNDLETLEKIFEQEGENIAAVILEPVPGNMGCIPPNHGYLDGVRSLTEKYGTLLIFDEVMTGFRVALGGAQARYGIKPDITCLGKIIGGGLPVGAYGGRKDIMEKISPLGPVYQAGTLSGNPLAMTAGYTTLQILQRDGIYEKLEEKSAKLAAGMEEAAKTAGAEVYFTRVGSMFSAFFTAHEVTGFQSAATSDIDKFVAFFKALLKEGVYIAPSQFEAGFMSLVHEDKEIEKTIEACYKAFKIAGKA